MSNSPEELQIEFEKLYQYLSDSLDNGLIKGDHYDCAQYIISKAYPEETREINIDEGNLDEDADSSEIGGTVMLDMLFEVVEDKATFISDFRKAIDNCRTWNPDEVAQEIINSR
ncbi:hypothetical protein [Polynucleobacter sp. es-EL-1]|jgi:hypothetical protein|uniref:hypothetical protein n=1 Tax=Polynucleobacter sp. es-EL-1 TaxID=1855652 RepID=UPI001BFDE3DA|nr:hypothetical protein [Polynucleobacter sp. es-EL-1]QWE10243.1 hypothetical protein FD974_07820 [Polynucleobacter sp. es-EL-1]